MLVKKKPLKRQLNAVIGKEPDYLGSDGDEELVRHDNKTGDSYLPILRVFSPMNRPTKVEMPITAKKEKNIKQLSNTQPKRTTMKLDKMQIGKVNTQSLMERHRKILVAA